MGEWSALRGGGRSRTTWIASSPTHSLPLQRINAVAEDSKMTTDALVSEVTISVIGGEDTDVEVMQYQGTIDLDQLHEVLIREFPQLQVREVDY